MQELLLGDDDEAARFFSHAIELDEDCSPLAYIGLYLARTSSNESDEQALAVLSGKLSDMRATPPETYYLHSLLSLAERNVVEAQQSFTQRADQYRGDVFSACWSIQLLHYQEQGYDDDGNVRPLQAQAIERAVTFHGKHPHHPMACYLRALVEESAPVISTDALSAAQEAVELLPDHPTVQFLYAHLLYRSGQFDAAQRIFHVTAELAQTQMKESIYLRARLYESVALWSMGKEKEALAIRRELNKLPVSEYDTFLQWESHTLPLRILILRKAVPQQYEINAAVRTALPQGEKGKDPYTLAILCIKDAVSVRMYLQQRKKTDAIVAMRRAEANLQSIEQLSKEFIKNNPNRITYWLRLLDACSIAVNVAREQLYPSTAETWRENIQSLSNKPSTNQLPPAVPTQSK